MNHVTATVRCGAEAISGRGKRASAAAVPRTVNAGRTTSKVSRGRNIGLDAGTVMNEVVVGSWLRLTKNLSRQGVENADR